MPFHKPDFDRYGFQQNALMNSNFDVWQRGSTVTESAANTFEFIADRWEDQIYSGVGGGSNTGTYSRLSFTFGQTAVPNNPSFAHRFNASSLGTEGSSGAFMRTHQGIHEVGKLSNETITVSFWGRVTSGTRDVAICVSQFFGSGGSPSSRVDVGGEEFTMTTTWQRFSTTVTVPSVSGKTIGNDGNDYTDIAIIYYKQDNATYATPSGQVGTWATGIFDIAQAQVTVGSVLMDYTPLTFNEEFTACKRYFEMSFPYGTAPADGVGSMHRTGHTLNTAILETDFNYTVEKWAVPTITFYRSADGGTAGVWAYYEAGWADGTTMTAVDSKTTGLTVRINKTGLTAYRGQAMSGHLTATADI